MCVGAKFRNGTLCVVAQFHNDTLAVVAKSRSGRLVFECYCITTFIFNTLRCLGRDPCVYVVVTGDLDCIPVYMFRCYERCVLAKFRNSTLCVFARFHKDRQCVVVRSRNDTPYLPNFASTHSVLLRNFAMTHLHCLICKRFICVVAKFRNDTSLGFPILATAYLVHLRCLLRPRLAPSDEFT